MQSRVSHTEIYWTEACTSELSPHLPYVPRTVPRGNFLPLFVVVRARDHERVHVDATASSMLSNAVTLQRHPTLSLPPRMPCGDGASMSRAPNQLP